MKLSFTPPIQRRQLGLLISATLSVILVTSFFYPVRAQASRAAPPVGEALQLTSDGTQQSNQQPQATTESAQDITANSFELAVLQLINTERQKQGLSALRWNAQLNLAARNHSSDMAVNNYFSHTGSDHSGFDVRLRQANYVNWTYAGENIAAGFSTPQDVLNAWMNSPGHRANILSPNYNETGVGYVDDTADQANVRLDDGSTSGPFYAYWTQDFGYRPNIAPAVSQVVAYITSPSAGQQVSGVITLSGWAIDRGTPDTSTGIDRVDVYLDGNYATGRFVGNAQYGLSHPDVGTYFGSSQWNNSGWQLTLDTRSLSAGSHSLYAYARSTLTGQFSQMPVQSFSVASQAAIPPSSIVQIAIGQPSEGRYRGNSFNISGWAVDYGSLSGPGVDRVDVYIDGTYASGHFVGIAQYGLSRPDVASYLGNSRYTNSGFQLWLDVSRYANGTHALYVYARSTVTGQFTQAEVRHFVIAR